MAPKDKGMLRELLDEYGPSVVIRVLVKTAYGPRAGEFLRRLAQQLDPHYVDSGGYLPGAVTLCKDVPISFVNWEEK